MIKKNTNDKETQVYINISVNLISFGQLKIQETITMPTEQLEEGRKDISDEFYLPRNTALTIRD